MATLASLNVFLGLNSARFRQGLSQSTRDFKSFASVATRQAKQVAGVFAKITAGATASVPVIAYAASRTIESLEQVRKEASNVGVAVEQWQAYSYATKMAGLESDNLKDVIKDLNVKITDAAKTGGGSMIDFFTMANESATDWAKLDPASQFEKFVTEINKLPQSEARFWLDEINDSAAELFDTLIANEGEFFANAQQARELGLVMSGDVLNGVKESRKQIVALNNQFGALWDNTVAVAAPMISAIAQGVRSWLEETVKAKGGFTALGQTISLSIIAGIQNASKVLENFINESAKSIDSFGEALGVDLWKTDSAERRIDQLLEQINELKIANEGIRVDSNDVPIFDWLGTEEDLQKLKRLEGQLQALSNQTSKLVDFSGVNKLLNDAKKSIEGYKPVIVDTTDEIKNLGKVNSLVLENMANDWQFLTDHIKVQQLSTESIIKNSYDNIQNGIANNISTAIVEQTSGAEALRLAFKSATQSIISDLIKMGLQRIATHLFVTKSEEAINVGASAARKTLAIQEAGAIAAAMTPAAAAKTLATGGASAVTSGVAIAAFMALLTAKLAGAREKGGDTRAGLTYLVGEKGPELFTPSANGQISSNANLRNALGNDSPGQTVTIKNNFYGIGDSMENVTKFSRRNANRMKKAYAVL